MTRSSHDMPTLFEHPRAGSVELHAAADQGRQLHQVVGAETPGADGQHDVAGFADRRAPLLHDDGGPGQQLGG